MTIDQITLILLFLTPGYIISYLFERGKHYLLIPALSIFFWSFSSVFLPLNYLIKEEIGRQIVLFIFLISLLAIRKLKEIILIILITIFLETLNNYFGILHLVSTTEYSFAAGLENLNYSATTFNLPSIQINSLKFFSDKYIFLTIPLLTGSTLFAYNTVSLIQFMKYPKFSSVLTLPGIFIFCVLLEITTVRSHFFASQLFCFLIIECFKPQNKRVSENLFLIVLSMFFISRLENVFLYTPAVFLLLNKYFDNNDEFLKKRKYFKVLFFLNLPVLNNYYGFKAGIDIRSNTYLLVFTLALVCLLLVLRKYEIISIMLKSYNLLFSMFIVFLSFYAFLTFQDKAINSWQFIVTHLLDSHRGWLVATIFLIIISIYLINYEDEKLATSIFFHLFLVLFLIIASAPFQHSVYGGSQWSKGLTEIPIYNPYDESQTRSIIQLLLSFMPLTLLIFKKNQTKNIQD